MNAHARRLRLGQLGVGVVVLLIGLLLLLDELHYVDFVSWTRLWPLIVILFGVGQLSENRRGNRGGMFLIAVGLWLLVCSLSLFGVTYGNGWPLLLIFLGLAHLVVRRERAFGLLLTGVGIAFLAARSDWFEVDMSTYWPVLVIAGGFFIIIRSLSRQLGSPVRGRKR